jgi:PAS domain S-box-containing protein
MDSTKNSSQKAANDKTAPGSPSSQNSNQIPTETAESKQDRFHVAFENAPIGMAVVDFDYRLRRVNKALCKSLGYSVKELLEQRFIDISYADDIRRDVNLAEQLFREEIPSYRIEKRFVKKDGTIAWLDVTAMLIRDDEGKPSYGLAMVEDITARKQADQALRTSEERYRSFVVNSSEGIWRMDVEQPIDIRLPFDEQISLFYKYGYLAECNDAMARMHGYDRAEDYIGLRFGDSRFASNPASTGALKKLINSNYRLVDVKTEDFDKNNSIRYLSTNLLGIIVNGMLLRIWGVQRDETDQRSAEIQLEHSHEQLRHLSAYLQSLREKEKANLAREIHDSLGQALASTKIELSLLKKMIESSDEIDRAALSQKFKEIKEGVDQAIWTVKALSTELRPGVLDKFGLAAAIEWQCEEFSRRMQIKCSCNVPEQELSLSNEISTALFRILQEALTNVAVHSQATAVELTLKVDGSRVTLTIADNGRGITEDEIQAPASLGLLGMRERVEFLKGSFTVTGKSGKGTTITAGFNLQANVVAVAGNNRA